MKKVLVKMMGLGALAMLMFYNVQVSTETVGTDTTLASVLSTTQAQAETNGVGCNWGCVDGGGSCYCNAWYNYREASH